MSQAPSIETIIARFDALAAGEVGLFLCTDGKQFGAHIPAVDIRSAHVLRGFIGYGDTVAEALTELWHCAVDLENGDCLLVRHEGERRGVRWNGAAWKPVALPPAPEGI